jgi:transposase
MNVEVDHRKNRVMLRRTTEEKYSPSCIVERTKQGSGSIGIWACMTYDGVKFFKLFSGRLNSESYSEILENYLMPSLDLMENKEVAIFQQDNAPCHTAHRITDFLRENNVNTMKWPANSPDLNCIENLWSWLDIKLSKIQITNIDALKLSISDILSNVPVEITQNLVDSMPNRINECLAAKGGSTRY